MKLDWKKIDVKYVLIIIILILLFVVFKREKKTDEKIKEVENLIKTRDSLSKNIDTLHSTYISTTNNYKTEKIYQTNDYEKKVININNSNFDSVLSKVAKYLSESDSI